MPNQPPIFRNPKVIVFGEIVVDEGSKCVFRPWMDDAREHVGWEASLNGTTYIYVVPTEDNPPGHEPTFSLYVGPHGDPKKDRRLGPYDMRGDASG